MKTTKILVRVEQDLKDEAVKTAKAMGVSLSGYVRMLILKEFKL
jgi:antitoxin component of RelBE/YafQ-DinJ toxin-antitoxin module